MNLRKKILLCLVAATTMTSATALAIGGELAAGYRVTDSYCPGDQFTGAGGSCLYQGKPVQTVPVAHYDLCIKSGGSWPDGGECMKDGSPYSPWGLGLHESG